MKIVLPLLITGSILLTASTLQAQTNIFPSTGSAGIGTTTPDASSILEMASTTQGVLFPRMTKAHRDAIISPASGLLIYQTNSGPGLYYFDGSWKAVSKGVNKTLSNLTGPTAINEALLPASGNILDLGASATAWRNIYMEVILSSRGNGTVTIDAYLLSSGPYQYSLYVDRRLIDTKQMVLAK